jgi:hypothetical protein
MRSTDSGWTWLLATVSTHLVTTVVHGASHAAAHVSTTPLQNVFILAVIVIGPLVGLWLARRHDAIGGWLIAATMAGALAFGIVNHFMLPGGDRIDHVVGPWSMTFGASAVLLAISETAGAVVGIRYATRRVEHTS